MSDLPEGLTFSNPVTECIIEDWPIGRQRCRARFLVETKPKKGQRVLRWTENKTRTGWNKPKATTFSIRACIVTGSDGRTYIIRDLLSHIDVFQGDMKYTAGSVWKEDAIYADLMRLLRDASLQPLKSGEMTKC